MREEDKRLQIKKWANKRSLDDFNGTLTGSRVLIRLDLDVPLDQRGHIRDDYLIRQALPSLEYILDRRATAIIMSHLGNPGGHFENRFSLAQVCQRLKQLLDQQHKALVHHQVELAPDVIGASVCQTLNSIGSFGILVLENLRFDPREAANDVLFSQNLANLAGFYINDAFSASREVCASVDRVARYFPAERRAIGFQLQKELAVLNQLNQQPEQPFIALIAGGSCREGEEHLEEKLTLIEQLCPRVDSVLTGGIVALVFQLLQSPRQGGYSGRRPANLALPAPQSKTWQQAQRVYERWQKKLILPHDWLAYAHERSGIQVLQQRTLLPRQLLHIGDVGPETCAQYCRLFSQAKTIIWAGPVGQLEKPEFMAATLALAQTLASSTATTIALGGDTAAFIRKQGLVDRFAHVSSSDKAFFAHWGAGPFKVLANIPDLEGISPPETGWQARENRFPLS